MAMRAILANTGETVLVAANAVPLPRLRSPY